MQEQLNTTVTLAQTVPPTATMLFPEEHEVGSIVEGSYEPTVKPANWMGLLSERQNKQISYARKYVQTFKSRRTGKDIHHALYFLTNDMAALLDAQEIVALPATPVVTADEILGETWSDQDVADFEAWLNNLSPEELERLRSRVVFTPATYVDMSVQAVDEASPALEDITRRFAEAIQSTAYTDGIDNLKGLYEQRLAAVSEEDHGNPELVGEEDLNGITHETIY